MRDPDFVSPVELRPVLFTAHTANDLDHLITSFLICETSSPFADR